MSGLRDQLFSYANKTGQQRHPAVRRPGQRQSQPFTDVAAGVTFNGIAGQRASTTVAIPGTMDGQAVWMNVPTGNGVFNLNLGGANTGTALDRCRPGHQPLGA